MRKVELWTDIADLARKLNVTVDDLYFYRKHRHEFIREKDIQVGEKLRPIVKPFDPYKKLLRSIDAQLKRYPLPQYFYGSPRGRSAIDCALVHIGSSWILKLDLKNFFPNTRHKRIFNSLDRVCSDSAVRKLVTELCTFKHALPQGFPPSSTLAEITLLPLSHRIYNLSRRHGFRLSIYIDDVTISGDETLREYESIIRAMFKDKNFILNSKKSKLYSMERGCSVTGVLLKNGVASTTPQFDEQLAFLEWMAHQTVSFEYSQELLRKIDGKKGWRSLIQKHAASCIYHRPNT